LRKGNDSVHPELGKYQRVFYAEIERYRARRPGDQRPNMVLLERLAKFLTERGAALRAGNRYLFPLVDEVELTMILWGALDSEDQGL